MHYKMPLENQTSTTAYESPVWLISQIKAHSTIGFAVLTAIVTALVLAVLVPHQMIYHDEGQYGEGAVRILAGQLPHRDFHEMYTGALSYLHAAVFSVFGRRLDVIRYALVVFTVPVSVVAFDVVRRVTGVPWVAFVYTTAILTISIGTTHAPSPSSYLMLCSLLAIGALMRDVESKHHGWVFAAGIACGMALTIKVTGLFCLAAAGMTITFRGDITPITTRARWPEHAWRLTISVVAIASAFFLIREHFSISSALYFFVPVAAMGIALAAAGARFTPKIVMRYLALVAGTALPVIIFLIPWWREGALEDFWQGMFVLPRLRTATMSTYYPPPSPIGLLAAIPTLCCFLARPGCRWRWLPLIGAVALVPVLVAGIIDQPISRFKTHGILISLAAWRWLLPLLSVAATVQLVRTPHASVFKRMALFCLTTFAAFLSLNQYPFTSPIYFFFCVPFVLIAAISLACFEQTIQRSSTAPLPKVALFTGMFATIALLCFCAMRFGVDGFYGEYSGTVRGSELRYLSGVAVPAIQVDVYDRLLELADNVLSEDQTLLAGPDCPQVYFLTGRPNPTAYMYDMFVTDPDYYHKLLELAHSDKIGMVVVNRAPEFSAIWPATLFHMMAEKFVYVEEVGRFVVITKRLPTSSEPDKPSTIP